MLENLSLLISKYSYWLVIALIIGVLLYYFILKPREMKKQKSDDKENPIKRTVRGFGVMYDKLRESDFVKNVQEQNANADSQEFLPKELFVPEELEPKKKKIKPEKNPFATDFSTIGQEF